MLPSLQFTNYSCEFQTQGLEPVNSCDVICCSRCCSAGLVCCTNFAEVSEFRLLDSYITYLHTYMGIMYNLSVLPPILFLRKDNNIC